MLTIFPLKKSTQCVLEKYGLVHERDNGVHVLNHADYERLVVFATQFEHRWRRLLTRHSNNSHSVYQVIYILT